MASTDTIGDVSQINLITTNAQSETITTNITTKFIIANPDATYGLVDTGQKALANLLNDTYSDSNLITTFSVTQIIAQDEG